MKAVLPDNFHLLDTAFLMALAAMMAVLLPFLARGLEARYQGIRSKADDKTKEAAVEAEDREHLADREQSTIKIATDLLERYSTRLELAYDRERARREALDDEVARLRLEVASLRLVVSELNGKLAQFMGIPAPVIPVPVVPTSRVALPVLSAVEKREAEVGAKPDITSLKT